jgi:hypothetical protein
MIDTSFLQPIHDSAVALAIRQSSWMFPAMETAHFIGLSLLVGAMVLVDLRLLGVVRAGSVKDVLRFTYLAIAGFSINLLSGIGFFVSNPENYAQNPLFWAKMSLVLLAGLNVLWFELAERGPLLALPDGAALPSRTRAVAALSLVLWTGIIVLGRLLPLLGLG